MKRISWIDVLSLFVLGILAAMTAVFFACGDDDDNDDNDDTDSSYGNDDADDDSDDDADDDDSPCQDMADHLKDCWYDYFGWPVVYESRFISWCQGAGYEQIGRWSYYDFSSWCFTGSCEDINDKGSRHLPGWCVDYDPYDIY